MVDPKPSVLANMNRKQRRAWASKLLKRQRARLRAAKKATQ